MVNCLILTSRQDIVNNITSKFYVVGGLMLNVYLAHPIGGDIERNTELVKQIYQDFSLGTLCVPIAPYISSLIYLNDEDPGDRLKGMLINKEHFIRGLIDEVWLYGDRISAGMRQEILWARECGIPVVPKTEETELELIRLEIQIGDLVRLQACSGLPNAIEVEYLGELPEGKGFRLRTFQGIVDVPRADIITLTPLIFKEESSKSREMSKLAFEIFLSHLDGLE
jgi:hypothetical protein